MHKISHILSSCFCAARATPRTSSIALWFSAHNTAVCFRTATQAVPLVVAHLAQRYAVCHDVSQLRCFSPWFNMMGDKCASALLAVLACMAVAAKHILTPLAVLVSSNGKSPFTAFAAPPPGMRRPGSELRSGTPFRRCRASPNTFLPTGAFFWVSHLLKKSLFLSFASISLTHLLCVLLDHLSKMGLGRSTRFRSQGKPLQSDGVVARTPYRAIFWRFSGSKTPVVITQLQSESVPAKGTFQFDHSYFSSCPGTPNRAVFRVSVQMFAMYLKRAAAMRADSFVFCHFDSWVRRFMHMQAYTGGQWQGTAPMGLTPEKQEPANAPA
jgi:hypothetical protein